MHMYVIAGLGNPGSKYEGTRHNVGFAAVEEIAREIGSPVIKSKFKALIGEGKIGGEKVILVKPQTYMNLSGQSILSVMDYYDVPIENLIVIFDDVDTDLGAIRIRKKGSGGTHNGMRSIISELKGDGFPRVRIGIGKAPDRMPLADFVLSRFSSGEGQSIYESVMRAKEAAIAIVKQGVDESMNAFNRK